MSQVGRIICRIVRSGNDVVFHWHSWYKLCFAYLSSPFNSDQGYTCQRLRIMEGCTVYWFPYTARDSYHPELSLQDKWRMEIRCWWQSSTTYTEISRYICPVITWREQTQWQSMQEVADAPPLWWWWWWSCSLPRLHINPMAFFT